MLLQGIIFHNKVWLRAQRKCISHCGDKTGRVILLSRKLNYWGLIGFKHEILSTISVARSVVRNERREHLEWTSVFSIYTKPVTVWDPPIVCCQLHSSLFPPSSVPAGLLKVPSKSRTENQRGSFCQSRPRTMERTIGEASFLNTSL